MSEVTQGNGGFCFSSSRRARPPHRVECCVINVDNNDQAAARFSRQS